MNVLELASCIPYALGQPRILGVSAMDDFPENCVGRWSNNYTSEEPMNCLGGFFNTFASEGSPTFYRNSVVCFQEQIVFVWKTDYFTRIRLTYM